jgi:hypothetical protein
MLVKVQPLDEDTAKLNPLRTAGITSSNMNQIQQQALNNFVREMKKQQDLLRAVLDTFVDFIRRKVVDDFRHVFGNFETISVKFAEALSQMGGPQQEELRTHNICSPSRSLSLWLAQITENLLVRQSLLPFFINPHTIGSLGPSMKIVIDTLKQLTPQNINVCDIVERALAPIVIKQVLTLLDEVIAKGLDYDSDLQGTGFKKYKMKLGGPDQANLQAYFFDLKLFSINTVKEFPDLDTLL